MHDNRTALTRRTLIAAALGLVAVTAPALAAEKRRKTKRSQRSRDRGDAARAPAVEGTPLPIPRLVDLKDGETFDLVAEPTTHAFVAGKPVAAVGYGGTYMGPVLRVRRGARPTVRLINRLARPTNLHWHGLLLAGRADADAGSGIAPGESRAVELAVDQPAATLWYRAQVLGRAARDVHDGLCGLMIVEDGTAARLGLPSNWGVDDLPLILQDRDIDAGGHPVYVKTAAVIEHGFHGPHMVVNGVTEAVAKVPARLVRLRLVNASGSRAFRLFFEDQRGFRQIASDAGFLAEPAELTLLVLAPGERAEILVDFTEGATALLTGPDEHEHRTGAQIAVLADVIDRPARLVAFDVAADKEASAAVPAALVDLPALPKTTGDLKRRRFELRMQPNPAAAAAVGRDRVGMSHGSMTHGLVDRDGHAMPGEESPVRSTINGKSFAAGRIDETVKLGATEIWEIVCPDMAHPFHLQGAHFRVLSEDGGKPKLWNRGVKDTVLVENSAELLVTFTRPAGPEAPFVYRCCLLEHEDGGMMGSFTVG